MATMIVQNQVADYAKWKAAYDDGAALRKSGGEVSDDIYRDADDPNNVTIIFKWDSIENAKKFAMSPELKEAMEKAGVTGPPTISFLKKA